MSRACVEVNLSAIVQNFKSIKSRTTADVLAVVKADAYGHGLIPVSKTLEGAGADWFGNFKNSLISILFNSGVRACVPNDCHQ